MATCALPCTQFGLFLYNFMIALSGWIILIVGIWTQNSFNDYADFVGDAGYSVAELMIIFGGIAFVVAFFGCCVAIEQSPSMIRSFVVCLVGIIIFEIGIGFAGILKYKELDNTLKRGFNRTLINYQDNQPAWKLVQTNLNCCGMNGPDDWKPVFNNTTVLPEECCKNVTQPSCDRNDKNNVIENGCRTELLDFLYQKSLILGVVGLAVAQTQILGLLFTCYLHKTLRHNSERSHIRSPKSRGI